MATNGRVGRQVVHTYAERMSYRPWRRVFVYERGQCGSADDIMTLSSDHAVMTVDVARGTAADLSASSVVIAFHTYL